MSRRRWALMGGIVALLAVAAVAWWAVAALRPASPEDAAQAYLHALESGDPAQVTATGIDVSEDALTAFAGATATIADAAVTRVRDGDDEATATVSFRLDGAAHEARLRLTPQNGRWTVDDSGLGRLTASTTIGSAVALGGAVIPAGEQTALLPAVYPVAAAPTALLAGASEVVVLPDEVVETEVTAELRPETTEAAQEQLDSYLETCTAGGSATPGHCGIWIPWGTEFRAVTGVAFTVERFPAVALTPTTFTADDGVLVATVTGTGQDGAPRSVTYRSETWSVRGEVAFTADDLILTVR
ncbi:hypothetical protein [Microbacterium sp. BLY]|uniref:hypothetical protein n=1 Tax=Microbacterium sp. BLY TaxID=2823280 RepID=UPI001B33FAEE|nr:hypothetical protein [Microbacterium sp. BLY]MBP3977818.1 hypothetical protein [Microbacterium sp. BLY]